MEIPNDSMKLINDIDNPDIAEDFMMMVQAHGYVLKTTPEEETTAQFGAACEVYLIQFNRDEFLRLLKEKEERHAKP